MNHTVENQHPKSEKVVVGIERVSPYACSLDQQRSLSMADEGGFSAALIDGDVELSERWDGAWGPEGLLKLSSGIFLVGIGAYLLRSWYHRLNE